MVSSAFAAELEALKFCDFFAILLLRGDLNKWGKIPLISALPLTLPSRGRLACVFDGEFSWDNGWRHAFAARLACRLSTLTSGILTTGEMLTWDTSRTHLLARKCQADGRRESSTDRCHGALCTNQNRGKTHQISIAWFCLKRRRRRREAGWQITFLSIKQFWI